MAHEVETMMYTNEVPWHGLGRYVGDEPIRSRDAIIQAGLNWEVELRDLNFESKDGLIGGSVPAHKAVVRVDPHVDYDSKILGVVGNRYQPIQNVEAFEFMDSLVDDGSMRYHTAGSLRDGRNVWLLGKTGSFDVVPGDQVDKYLLLWNSHDGSSALKCLFTSVRVVCANTARVALANGNMDGIKIHHTANIMNNLHQAKEVLGFANTSFDIFEQNSKNLTTKQMNTQSLEKFVTHLFPDPKEDVKSYAAKKARDQVTRLFEEGKGNDMVGVKGTHWAAFNAVTEYSNFHKNVRGEHKQERRFETTMLGSGVHLIQKAQYFLNAA